MGYDWELIDQLHRKMVHARNSYRCGFVDAIQAWQTGRATFENSPIVSGAMSLLGEPYNVQAAVGARIRGYVRHRDGDWARANTISGEFEAR